MVVGMGVVVVIVVMMTTMVVVVMMAVAMVKTTIMVVVVVMVEFDLHRWNEAVERWIPVSIVRIGMRTEAADVRSPIVA